MTEESPQPIDECSMVVRSTNVPDTNTVNSNAGLGTEPAPPAAADVERQKLPAEVILHLTNFLKENCPTKSGAPTVQYDNM